MLAPPTHPPRRLHDAARRRLRVLAWTTALLLAGLSAQLAPLQPEALSLQFAYTPWAFGAIVHRWSPAQLAAYRAHLPVDGLLLLAYGALGWTLARYGAWFDSRTQRQRHRLAWVLPLAAAADAVENLFHLWLTAAPRFGVPWAYLASTAASATKWALLVGFALAAAWALATQRDAGQPGPGA